MRTKITLALDDQLLKEVRVLAAGKGMSLSALLVDHLQTLVRERSVYARARHRAVLRLRRGGDLGWAPSSRDELHGR